MKQTLLLILFLVVTGCGTGHYYKVQEETVGIYLKIYKATLVHFASSLDGYKLHKAERLNENTWVTHVPANKEFTYFYIVDGVVHVPSCRMTELDDFGSENCIYVPGM